MSGPSIATKSPKVAFVANWDWVLFNFRLPVAAALRAQGGNLTLICPDGKYVPEFRAAGYRWLPWTLSRRSMSPVSEARALLHLHTLYRRERFDLVHHFTIKPNIYGSIAARAARVPHVVNTFSGLGFLFSDARCARLARTVLSLPVRAVLRSPTVWTVVQTREDRDVLRRMGWTAEARCALIEGSGVDVNRFRPHLRVDGTPLTVLVAARLLSDKGIREFVEAARQLVSQGVAARFVVAGEPDTGNPASVPVAVLESWAREGHVEFLGHVEDMAAMLGCADIAVLPSYYCEGVPKFLLEAAASGLPLIAAESPGARSVIQDGENGLIVAPRDAHALAIALSRLLTDPDLVRRFGEHSRRVALTRFDEKQIVGEYLDVYRRMRALR